MTEHPVAHALPRTTVLRLLSGLQQGAEARLTDGVTYMIGSADACDIVVQDPSVALKHINVVMVKPGQIRLDALEQPITVGDRRLSPGQSIELAAATALRLGGVRIGIGPEASDWAALADPEPVESVPAAVPKAEPGEFRQPSSGLDAAPADRAAQAAQATQQHWSTRRWSALGGLALIMLALIVLWKPLVSSLEVDATVGPARAVPSAAEKTQALLADQGLQHVNVVTRPDGGVILEGYCETRGDKNRLTVALRAQGVAVDNRIWSEDALQETLANTLERLGGQWLSYDYSGNGMLRLRGRLPPHLSHDQLIVILRNDLPGIRQIDSQVKTLAEGVTDLQGRLSQAGLAEDVVIATEGEAITATGALNAERLARWQAVAREFAAGDHGVHPLHQRVKLNRIATGATAESASPPPTPAPTPAAPISVRGVVIGADQHAYALLGNGIRVAEGDWIQSRYVVERIQFNRVVVRDGAQSKTYYIGDAAHE